MKKINIFRAQSTDDISVEIAIKDEICDLREIDWEEKEYRARFTEQGKLLGEALCSSLPGGTVDALLVFLLDKKRSMFVVPFITRTKL